MKQVILILTTFIILAACNSSGVDPNVKYKLDQLHQKLMDAHDAVMPKMSDTNRLRKTLSKQLATAEGMRKDSIQDFIYRLTDADEAMMNWMSGWKKPAYTDQLAAEKIYAEEQVKIEAVADKMLGTIETVEAFLAR